MAKIKVNANGITDGTITATNIADGTITSAKILDGTIANADIASGAAIASSKLSITSPLSITGNSTAGSEIRLPEDTDNGSNYVALKAADSIASNLTFTLPSADGSANQALITNGSGSLSFATVGATAGQVIQVVTATDSTSRSTTSSSYSTASTMSVNITPSSTSNKIFVIASTSMAATNGYFTIFRDSTDLNLAYYGSQDVYNAGALSILDSPNTTSQVNYQFRFKSNSGTTEINVGPAKGAITAFEIKG